MNKLQKLIDNADRIVFFGGAGVSTESGIPDFRSMDGLYHQTYDFPPEQILSHSFFINHTEEFYLFYRKKMLYLKARPNTAHIKLAQLEQSGKLRSVITQNIDGLHQAAGSKRVLELHGSIHRNYCMKCHKFYGPDAILTIEGIPHCECGGILKPDVVLYEEGLDPQVMEDAIADMKASDLLIIGGTSLNVYPAAGMVRYFCGSNLVLINRDATPLDEAADLVIRQNIGEVFSSISIH